MPGSGTPMDTENPKSDVSNKGALTLLSYDVERRTDSEHSNITDPHYRQGGAHNFGQSENRNSQKEKDELIKIQDENKKQKIENSRLIQLIKEKTNTIKEREKEKNNLQSELQRAAKDSERRIAELRTDFTKQLRQMEEDRHRLQNTIHSRERRITELENEKRKMREKRMSGKNYWINVTV